MKHYTVLIKPSSSLCNMRCAYCFYANVASLREVKSYGLMTDVVAQKLIDNVFACMKTDDEVTFVFQGGEPTLAGIDFFRAFVAHAEEERGAHKIDFAIQTNGILIDDRWCEFLHEKKFLVGLSLDADKIFHDATRVDENREGTFERVVNTKKLFEKFSVEYNVLCVLTNQLAENPKRVWNFFVHNNVKFVQFVPCLSDLDEAAAQQTSEKISDVRKSAQSEFSLTPRGFAKFYNELFPLWQKRFENGKYISIKFFDDIFNLLVNNAVTACGFTGVCSPQIVVEADGSVYPCDFYVLDKWKIGDVTCDTLDSLVSCDTAKKFSGRCRTCGKLCEKCSYKKFCGGGCPRMKDAMYLDKQEKFCGYKNFLDTNKKAIEKVAANLSALT